jgi:hypothetical protein
MTTPCTFRDPRILHEDLCTSERNLHKHDYRRKIVRYIEERSTEMKFLVRLLDRSLWRDDMEFTIYAHFQYAHSMWVNGSIEKEMFFIFHDYVEYVVEAVASVFLTQTHIHWEKLYKDSQELLLEIEKSHYNISNSS